MPSHVIQQLERFGPDHCPRLNERDARAYALDLATSHYENFAVVSRLLPAALREDFAAVYAFCRWSDDLGDEVGDPRRSLELLGWWRDELACCYAGEPRHPVFVALAPTIRTHQIPSDPFEKLISAFEQDQTVHRYQTWSQVVDYCRRSADPVGRLVLYMAGHRDDPRHRLSDRTCTALQLANFWQDVRRDIAERDRIYVPGETLADHGLSHDDLVEHVAGRRALSPDQAQAYRAAVLELVGRTWPLFRDGRRLWPLVRRDVRLSVRLFTLGGESVLRKIEAIGGATLDRRPVVGRASKLALMAKGLIMHALDRRPAPRPDPTGDVTGAAEGRPA